jgi:hypothetical protein
MGRLFKLTALFLAVSSTASDAGAREWKYRYVVNRTALGCQTMADVNHIKGLKDAGQDDQANQYFFARVAIGQCSLFRLGRVKVVGADDGTHICVKRKTDPACFFVASAGVTRAKVKV